MIRGLQIFFLIECKDLVDKWLNRSVHNRNVFKYKSPLDHLAINKYFIDRNMKLKNRRYFFNSIIKFKFFF